MNGAGSLLYTITTERLLHKEFLHVFPFNTMLTCPPVCTLKNLLYSMYSQISRMPFKQSFERRICSLLFPQKMRALLSCKIINCGSVIYKQQINLCVLLHGDRVLISEICQTQLERFLSCIMYCSSCVSLV